MNYLLLEVKTVKQLIKTASSTSSTLRPVYSPIWTYDVINTSEVQWAMHLQDTYWSQPPNPGPKTLPFQDLLCDAIRFLTCIKYDKHSFTKLIGFCSNVLGKLTINALFLPLRNLEVKISWYHKDLSGP
jgi:hypothetical protein